MSGPLCLVEGWATLEPWDVISDAIYSAVHRGVGSVDWTQQWQGNEASIRSPWSQDESVRLLTRYLFWVTKALGA